MHRSTERRRPWRAIAAVAFSLSLVAAACGTDDDDADDGPVDTGPENGEAAEGEFELVESSTPAMLAALDSAVANDEPIVVTLWTPHWAYDAYPIKNLEDPDGAWGEPEEI